jgi:hypothetical protein
VEEVCAVERRRGGIEQSAASGGGCASRTPRTPGTVFTRLAACLTDRLTGVGGILWRREVRNPLRLNFANKVGCMSKSNCPPGNLFSHSVISPSACSGWRYISNPSAAQIGRRPTPSAKLAASASEHL